MVVSYAKKRQASRGRVDIYPPTGRQRVCQAALGQARSSYWSPVRNTNWFPSKRHLLINLWTRIEQTHSIRLGGLIADVMGLGKTLTMLSAILHSAPDADIFSNFHKMLENESVERLRTKASLVIVSSAGKSNEIMYLKMV